MLAAVVTAAREARAQYGYGYGGYGGYGWGGWGSTPGSSMARGLGMLNMGRGMYNVRHGPGRIDQHQHRHEMEPGHVQRPRRRPGDFAAGEKQRARHVIKATPRSRTGSGTTPRAAT